MAKQTNKEKALIALLSTDTIVEAAAACGLSVDSIYRYLRDSEFKKDYRAHRREMMETTIGRLQRVSDKATDTLERNLNCGNFGNEIRAAQIVLENATKGVETADILERLEALENEHSK